MEFEDFYGKPILELEQVDDDYIFYMGKITFNDQKELKDFFNYVQQDLPTENDEEPILAGSFGIFRIGEWNYVLKSPLPGMLESEIGIYPKEKL